MPSCNQGGGQLDQLGRAGDAMGQAEGQLGQGNTDSAVEFARPRARRLARGRAIAGAIDAAADGAGQRPGPRPGFGEARGDTDTDPLGRPLRGHEYSDNSSVKVPGDIDVQRARRILEELRKRFGEFTRPQEELDYLAAAAEELLAPSPRLRGEGWGEGASPPGAENRRLKSVSGTLIPTFSPRAGRGVTRCGYVTPR